MMKTMQTMVRPLRQLGAASLLLALGAATASLAQAQPGMGGSMGMESCAPHGAHAGRGGAGAMMLPERMLNAVGATAEQKARIGEIYKAAQADLAPQRAAGQAVHQQMMQLWAAPQVDAAAAEALRQQQLAHHDTASKRMLQAMLEVQAVLTPEQRQKLATQMKARGDMMQRHQRERQSLMPAPQS